MACCRSPGSFTTKSSSRIAMITSSHFKERYTHRFGGRLELTVLGRERQAKPDRQLQVRGVIRACVRSYD